MRKNSAFAIGLLSAALAGSGAFSAPLSSDPHSWEDWGNGLRYNRYSSADQINRSNVGTLKPVWNIQFPKQRGGWELTPVVIKGVMYGTDLKGNAYAWEPETGKEIWHFASGVSGKSRAVSYWPGDAAHGPRIIFASLDRIYALDPATGKPVAGFGGERGYVDIREGFSPPRVQYKMSSPTTIYKNLIITGASTQEFGSKGPPGDPRAYDAITGKLVWRFHSVPQPGDVNFDKNSWGAKGWQGRSGPGAWGMFSLDEATGTIFVPFSQPADNMIGVDRPGDNLYTDSLVALDAATGKYRWHFQAVHHDLWDYDLASPAALIDLNVKGKKIPAVVEMTKVGFMWILDRRTGKPVFGMEERPVPQSTIPGEHTAPTQPFPVKPVPLGKLEVTRRDISTITPEANRYCTDLWNRLGFRDATVFTPPTLTAPLLFIPSNVGGGGGVWDGVSIDPNTNYIYTNITNLAAYSSVLPDGGEPDPRNDPANGPYKMGGGHSKYEDPSGMPCIQPPWGEMVAVNGNTGEIAWRAPLGKSEVYGEMGKNTGLINAGGSVVTAGGLVFVGSTSMGYGGGVHDDPDIRAYDAKTGIQLWGGRLSAGMKSTPMTFIGKDGRQYLLVTTGGRPDTDIAMVAFALPRPGDKPVDIHPAPMPPLSLGKDAPTAPPKRAGRGGDDD